MQLTRIWDYCGSDADTGPRHCYVQTQDLNNLTIESLDAWPSRADYEEWPKYWERSRETIFKTKAEANKRWLIDLRSAMKTTEKRLQELRTKVRRAERGGV